MDEYFSSKDLLHFYFRFFLNKRRILTDCKEGMLQIFIVEFLWVAGSLAGLSIYSSFLIYKDFFKTKKGNFLIHKDLQSAITVSPTFEIDDIHELERLMSQHVKRKEKILFIDVGAHVGIYSVSVGLKFKKYKYLDIIGFEPEANNFYKNNSSILAHNILLNGIKNFKLYKIGLGSRDTKNPNKFGFITKKLDNVLSAKTAQKYDVVFVKIDIEGYEEDALRGASVFIKKSKKVYILVEDCVRKDIYKYLKKNFVFYKKITPYNSFWTK